MMMKLYAAVQEDSLAAEIESRENVYKNYQAALTTKGDAAKGMTVFQNVCGTYRRPTDNMEKLLALILVPSATGMQLRLWRIYLTQSLHCGYL